MKMDYTRVEKLIRKPGRFIIGFFKLSRLLEKDKFTSEYVLSIYPRQNSMMNRRRVFEIFFGVVMGVIFLILLALLAVLTSPPESSEYFNGTHELIRQSEDETVDLIVTSNGKNSWVKKFRFDLKKREFTNDELSQIDKQVKSYLDEHFLGKNISYKQISNKLNLISEIPDCPMEFKWTYDSDLIKENGGLIRKKIPASGVDTQLSVEASMQNFKKTYNYDIHILPIEANEIDSEISKTKSAIKKTIKDQSTKDTVVLPDEIGASSVSYGVPKKGRDYTSVIVLLMLLVLSPLFFREYLKKKIKQRDEQMLLEHSSFVNKFMLLLSAGLTVRKTVERLCEEYEQEKERDGKVRYVYEELAVLNQEIFDGVSEAKAMEDFGKRCRLLPYIRFSSVITQNLKKGADGILDILEKEAMEALEQRKQRVVELGEKAGTKLLIPMVVMLALVMGIIMVPAFMNM